MKNYLIFTCFLLLLSCNFGNTENNSNSETAKKTKAIDTKQECIFDQATQTDAFLKGIKELEGYEWDAETKTAGLYLNDHWSLSIKRGGCDTFELRSNFVYDKILDFDKEKDIIFYYVTWITSILEEYNGDVIKEVIENEKMSITKDGEFKYLVKFTDERVSNSYFMEINNELQTTFFITHYIN